MQRIWVLQTILECTESGAVGKFSNGDPDDSVRGECSCGQAGCKNTRSEAQEATSNMYKDQKDKVFK